MPRLPLSVFILELLAIPQISGAGEAGIFAAQAFHD